MKRRLLIVLISLGTVLSSRAGGLVVSLADDAAGSNAANPSGHGALKLKFENQASDPIEVTHAGNPFLMVEIPHIEIPAHGDATLQLSINYDVPRAPAQNDITFGYLLKGKTETCTFTIEPRRRTGIAITPAFLTWREGEEPIEKYATFTGAKELKAKSPLASSLFVIRVDGDRIYAKPRSTAKITSEVVEAENPPGGNNTPVPLSLAILPRQ